MPLTPFTPKPDQQANRGTSSLDPVLTAALLDTIAKGDWKGIEGFETHESAKAAAQVMRSYVSSHHSGVKRARIRILHQDDTETNIRTWALVFKVEDR